VQEWRPGGRHGSEVSLDALEFLDHLRLDCRRRRRAQEALFEECGRTAKTIPLDRRGVDRGVGIGPLFRHGMAHRDPGL
jgi:hypothetical protein